jgi:hypothetical protein
VTALWADLTSSWPDLASAALTAIALALGGAYGYEKISDRVRRRPTAAADVIGRTAEPGPSPGPPSGRSLLDQILASPPISSPLPPIARSDPAQAPNPAGEEDDEDEPWAAEEMLTAPGTVAGQAIAASVNLVVRVYQASGGRHWLQLIAAAGVSLLLACLGFVLIIPLMLVEAFGYAMDSGHDIRLRIVIVLFLIDLAVQVIGSI